MSNSETDSSVLARVSQAVSDPSESRIVRRQRPFASQATPATPRKPAWTLPGVLSVTHMSTSFGEVPAHLVRVRDRLRTRDGTFLPVLRIDEYKLDEEFLSFHPDARPVLVRQGSLGANVPVRDAWFSPRQTILSPKTQTGMRLVDAGDIAEAPHQLIQPAGGLSYFVFHLGQAALVKSEGIWVSLGE
ncbi:MAG: Hint domain-containing protein [Pseudomonadota bacterium]